MKLSEQLKTVRESLGLSQAEAAAILGCGKRTLEHWEAGTRTPLEITQEGALNRLVAHFRDRLQWEQHPTMAGHLRGFLKDQPTLTLFLIEVCVGDPERGRLVGAVIPDDHEKDGGFERSLIWRLQKSVAPQYLAEFVAYLSHRKGGVK